MWSSTSQNTTLQHRTQNMQENKSKSENQHHKLTLQFTLAQIWQTQIHHAKGPFRQSKLESRFFHLFQSVPLPSAEWCVSWLRGMFQWRLSEGQSWVGGICRLTFLVVWAPLGKVLDYVIGLFQSYRGNRTAMCSSVFFSCLAKFGR